MQEISPVLDVNPGLWVIEGLLFMLHRWSDEKLNAFTGYRDNITV